MGENKIKLFLDEFMDWAAKKGDDLSFKKGVADIVDRPIYRGLLGLVNNTVSDDIPDYLKDDLHDAQKLIVAADYDDAAAEAVASLITLVQNSEIKEKVKNYLLAVLELVRSVVAGLD